MIDFLRSMNIYGLLVYMFVLAVVGLFCGIAVRKNAAKREEDVQISDVYLVNMKLKNDDVSIDDVIAKTKFRKQSGQIDSVFLYLQEI